MNIRSIFSIVAIIVISAFANAADKTNCKINIMSYNIRNGIGMDDKRDLSRTSATICAEKPDVVCVQEVDSVTGRSNGAYVLGDLAKETNMHPTFAAAIDFMGGKYGIGILSKTEPINVKRIALPGREERRALLIAEFDNYVVACTHLSLTPDDQLASVPLIVNEAIRYNKPFFLCGDFNAYPTSNVIAAFKEHFKIISQTKHASWPSDTPKDMIDYIMVLKTTAKGVKASNAHVVSDTLASDHLPQFVTVGIR
ncbi:MAG: endonuclease/exonuclease/phosphatase family protein [Muribaculaceae bacterium]